MASSEDRLQHTEEGHDAVAFTSWRQWGAPNGPDHFKYAIYCFKRLSGHLQAIARERQLGQETQQASKEAVPGVFAIQCTVFEPVLTRSRTAAVANYGRLSTCGSGRCH